MDRYSYSYSFPPHHRRQCHFQHVKTRTIFGAFLQVGGIRVALL
jgi:hypothetical protein